MIDRPLTKTTAATKLDVFMFIQTVYYFNYD